MQYWKGSITGAKWLCVHPWRRPIWQFSKEAKGESSQMFLVRFFREVEQEKKHILFPFAACNPFQPTKASTQKALPITVLFTLRAILLSFFIHAVPLLVHVQPAE